jgi:Arc/MetJ family transcription regulator
MKTTIDLPEELLKKAMRVTNSKTKVEAIKKALQEIINLEERKKLINVRGKIDLGIDLDVLRDRKTITQ